VQVLDLAVGGACARVGPCTHDAPGLLVGGEVFRGAGSCAGVRVSIPPLSELGLFPTAGLSYKRVRYESSLDDVQRMCC
jgi:hypothetical protein